MRVLEMLPQQLKAVLRAAGAEEEQLREIRLRSGRGLRIETCGGRYFIDERGGKVTSEKDAYTVTGENVKAVLELFTGYSLYAFEEELRQGYFTIEGGHRIGVAGRVVSEEGHAIRMKYISCLNIRIAHECKGCGEALFQRLYGAGHRYHTLLFAPAGCGKTTLLRDLIRLFSENGITVGVADERSELAACRYGVPQYDLGPETDVMDGCPKAEGMQMLLRSMTPQILAADEIGLAADAAAIQCASGSGCKVLATAHGGSLEEIKQNPILSQLWRERRFERYIELERQGQGFAVKKIYGREGEVL